MSTAAGHPQQELLAPSGLAAHLRALTSSTASPARASAYSGVLVQLLASPRAKVSPAELQQLLNVYIDATALADVNASGGGLVVGRQVLADFDHAIRQTAAAAGKESSSGVSATAASDANAMSVDEDSPNTPAIAELETRRQVIQSVVDRLQQRTQAFEEQITRLRIYLCTLLEAEEDWLEAAKALSGIPSLDASSRSMTDLSRLDTYVHIARLYLEADDTVQADVYLKRASHLLTAAQDAARSGDAAHGAQAKVLLLSYKLSQARIYDAQRRFLEAATRFHELSYVADIDDEERMQMLSAAVTASILAPAGPQRSRILAALVRDDRTTQLPQRTILSKVFLDHIVRQAEIGEFEKLLAPHQMARIVPSANDKAMFAMADAEQEAAVGAEGGIEKKRHGPSTVLDRAMMEHNVLAASRLYTTITLAGLSSLLGVSMIGAETIARRMILQRRLAAEIDQSEAVLTFREEARVIGGASFGEGSEMTNNVAASAGAGEDKKEDGAGALGAGAGGVDELVDDDLDPDAICTKRWDAHIARTAARLEDVYQRLLKQGVINAAASTKAAA
ncbi:hypothetical protein K437DRAFT_255327 [Tilletiaria anomala UBC 951]|uniref:COP9 signalosome complex subunit 4 n=1 Tax=Tilletiaria anomala (strain ATCC 24038 / CBS 436.72 / UBC 951) TaxID=1037660 RepID=A0A066W5F3_TILAU|nr:uncharacterized protein K437DRAFT_255327 [Tilletiaria anomala UBC 951]KDN49202.1 hypothetical protein K437DRAFT_255327 [Tilletiaria anomala UBC 951]